jgi:hypothetical protein
MTYEIVTARSLLVILTAYFALLFGILFAVGVVKPEALSLMPLGGTDVFEVLGLERNEQTLIDRLAPTQAAEIGQTPTAAQIGLLVLFLSSSLGGTILVMLPITWTYSAIKREVGFRKSFARSLLVLPICATTIVMLIQNNLALAFGLAAMVAAVRFRVALEEAIDGIFIFASICVGLAAGIGHLGVAAVMAVFFCFVNAILWKIEFGQNPIDDARVAKKQAGLKQLSSLTGTTQRLP